MKKTIIFASALAMLCSACEMKEELWSKDPANQPMGELSLNVLANAPTAMTRAEISTANFEVEIKGKDNLSDFTRSYVAKEMPEKISLPVGSYTVKAHTAGELKRQMAEPYYLGSNDVNIEANLTSKKEIACTMANSRISINYSKEFIALFKSWTITINDGTDQALCYTENDDPNDVFWYFQNDTKNLTVNIRAITQKGNKVETSATYNKSNSEEGYENIENEFFTGGDAISINLTPIEENATTGSITGIEIEHNITFDNYDETVTLHLTDTNKDEEDSNTEPENPTDDPTVPDTPTEPIVITEPNGTSYLTKGVEYTQYWVEEDEAGIPYYLNCPNDVAIHFDVPNGLQHLYVKISGSEEFEFMTNLLGLGADPYGLDLTDSSDENTAEIAGMDLFTMPVAGAKTYDFAFSEGIWRLLPGFVGTQNFKLRAVDTQGNVKESTLVVKINAME